MSTSKVMVYHYWTLQDNHRPALLWLKPSPIDNVKFWRGEED